MNFKNLLSELLVEANKRDVLITKLGLNEDYFNEILNDYLGDIRL